MNIRHLAYFVRAVELGSVTRAAIDLDVTQPALSRVIRLLETDLRQSLLTRTGRGVEPTEAGKVLLDHARRILHQMDLAREDVGRVRGSLGGRIDLGIPPGIAKMIAVPLITALREQLPDATLSISEGLSSQLQDQVIAGHLDMALLYNAAWSPELDCTCLLEEDFFLISLGQGVDDAPIKLRALASIPLIMPKRSHNIRVLLESRLAGLGMKPTIALEVDSVPAILDLVSHGHGSAVLSLNAVPVAARNGLFSCRPIVDPHLRTELMLATSTRRAVTLTQQTGARILREVTSQVLGRAPGVHLPSAATASLPG
jgi:LysR family nitrogen assimilation transcriptional regulator